MPINKNRVLKPLVFVSLVIYISLVIAGYMLYMRSVQQSIEPTTPENQNRASTISQSQNYTENQKKLLVLKEIDIESSAAKEVWEMNPDGTGLKKLKIENVLWADKPFGNSKAFYLKSKSQNAVYMYDFDTEVETAINPVKIDDEKVSAQIMMEGSNVSPDANYFLFSVMYVVDCDVDLSSIPENAPPMGWGPCTPEDTEKYKSGQYIYSIEGQKATYLGQDLVPSRWDPQKQTFYYSYLGSKDNGLFEINLNTYEVRKVSDAKTFGFREYPLFKNGNKSILFEGTTEYSSESNKSWSGIFIKNYDTGEELQIDEGEWADIQPFVSISPKEDVVLFERQEYFGGGFSYALLHLYNFETGKYGLVTTDTANRSFSPSGYWVDDDNFVTTVWRIEIDKASPNAFPDYIGSVCNINVRTGVVTPLTEEGFSF